MADSVATLTGAEALVSTLADHGVTACFANPGTSEMHLVTALDHEPRIRSVLCLFEGVATGAADGHARVTGQPAMTLLHLGAGYLNGGANIHNAKRAWTPMINVIGDHAVPHLRYDAPLTSNIRGLAGPNSVWIKSADRVADAGELAAEAWEASFGPVPGPVSLLLPADTAWTEGGKPGKARKRPALWAPDPDRIAAAAKAVRNAMKPVILINGTALTPAGLAQAARLKASGIRVLTDTFFPRMARGAGLFAPDRMQYFAEGAMADLEGADLMLLRGTLYVISGSTGSANVGIGVASAATTKGTDVLNDLDCQNLAGKVYNCWARENTAKTESGDAPVIWQDDYYLTFTGSATTAGLVARLYLEYVRL